MSLHNQRSLKTDTHLPKVYYEVYINWHTPVIGQWEARNSKSTGTKGDNMLCQIEWCYSEIIVLMWTCHHKQHALDFQHTSFNVYFSQTRTIDSSISSALWWWHLDQVYHAQEKNRDLIAFPTCIWMGCIQEWTMDKEDHQKGLDQ